MGAGGEDDDKTKCANCDNLSTLVPDCLGNNDGLCDDCRAKQTTLDWLLNMFASQDTQQMIQVTIQLLVQLYQMMIGSMLILFVPQDCVYLTGSGDNIAVQHRVCTLSENLGTNFQLDSEKSLHDFGIACNFIALGCFSFLYFCEYRRENCLIGKMDVNDDIPQDGDAVGEKLKLLQPEESLLITSRNAMYSFAFKVASCAFFVNTIVSAVVVFRHKNQSTTTTFVTSAMFILLKIVDIYSTCSAEPNVFISAYLRVKLQYNDVDDSIYNRIGLEAHEKKKPNKLVAAQKGRRASAMKTSSETKNPAANQL